MVRKSRVLVGTGHKDVLRFVTNVIFFLVAPFQVYEHAHKLHHYLHGTMAFDAHIYGNGMPEEIVFLSAELCMSVGFGWVP